MRFQRTSVQFTESPRVTQQEHTQGADAALRLYTQHQHHTFCTMGV